MPTKWKGTIYQGVRYREHPTRMHGLKKDRYFTIRYKIRRIPGDPSSDERIEESIGWSSERDPTDGKFWTPEKAALELERLKKAARMGEGPTRLSERRSIENKRKEAERAEEERLKKESITFKEFFEKTYHPISKTSKKESSSSHEEIHFRLWINPVIGKKPFRNISQVDIERIKRNLLDAGRSPRTVQYVMATIRQVWNMARREGLVTCDSPTRTVKIQKFDNRRQRFLSREEAGLLLGRIKTRSLNTYRMALLSLHTGMRAGEIFSLTWGCVDTQRGIIQILDAKSGRSRVAYMTDDIQEMFKGMDRGHSADIIFMDRKERPYKEVPTLFRDVVKELGFNDGIIDPRQRVTFHSLRHTFASWHAEAGTDLYVLKELLGHCTIAMTERYSHLGQNTLQAAVSTFEQSLQSEEQNEQARLNKRTKSR